MIDRLPRLGLSRFGPVSPLTLVLVLAVLLGAGPGCTEESDEWSARTDGLLDGPAAEFVPRVDAGRTYRSTLELRTEIEPALDSRPLRSAEMRWRLTPRSESGSDGRRIAWSLEYVRVSPDGEREFDSDDASSLHPTTATLRSLVEKPVVGVFDSDGELRSVDRHADWSLMPFVPLAPEFGMFLMRDDVFGVVAPGFHLEMLPTGSVEVGESWEFDFVRRSFGRGERIRGTGEFLGYERGRDRAILRFTRTEFDGPPAPAFLTAWMPVDVELERAMFIRVAWDLELGCCRVLRSEHRITTRSEYRGAKGDVDESFELRWSDFSTVLVEID